MKEYNFSSRTSLFFTLFLTFLFNIALTYVFLFSNSSLNISNCAEKWLETNATGYVSNYSKIENITFDRIILDPDIPDVVRTGVKKLIPKLELLARSIRKARQHVRGIKTSKALIEAEKTIAESLSIVGRDWKKVTQRRVLSATHICPERYMGLKYGSPLFEKGFVVQNCTYSKPLRELISIVVAYKRHTQYKTVIHSLVSAIRRYDERIPIYISAPSISESLITYYAKIFKNLQIYNPKPTSSGKAWNMLLNKVETPYVLIARDITWFNKDARLDRLIREMERLNVSTAGGATRDAKGHWSFSCYQRAFRNYTLFYEAGYDVSINECLVCDHVDGPFAIRTKDAKQTPFNETIQGQGLFEDYFLRSSEQEHVVCPDSMFYVDQPQRSLKGEDWKSFTKIWQVQRLKFSGIEVHLSCSSSFTCDITGGALSPCCMKQLSDLTNKAMDVCRELKVVCELQAGTLLGAVKTYSSLPWEVDSDVMFLSSNYSVLNSSVEIFSKFGYKLTVERPESRLKCCVKNTTRHYSGYFALRTAFFRLEYNGMPFLTSEKDSMDNFTPTLVSLNGNWVRVSRNPGLVVRNTYGHEIYQHALHASRSRQYGFPKKFSACSRPGHSSCLDTYNVDGNLQFRDPIP